MSITASIPRFGFVNYLQLTSKIISFVAQLIVSSKVRRVNKNLLFAEAPRCSRSHIRGSIPEWIGKRKTLEIDVDFKSYGVTMKGENF